MVGLCTAQCAAAEKQQQAKLKQRGEEGSRAEKSSRVGGEEALDGEVHLGHLDGDLDLGHLDGEVDLKFCQSCLHSHPLLLPYHR